MGRRWEISQTANRTVLPALPCVMAITVGGERQLIASASQMHLNSPLRET
jgi:hypothetical protein